MFGSLGLFRHLSALGKMSTGSQADLNRRVKRLPLSAKEEFKALQTEEKAKLDAARAESRRRYEEFLDRYKLARHDYKLERKVVAAFIHEVPEEGAGLKSDGNSLFVNGKEVASRDSMGSRFVKVCPGALGTDQTSRRAANAILDIMGAGLHVVDRGDRAFIGPGRGRGGRLVSENACYTVEMRKDVLKQAERARNQALVEYEKAAYAPGGEVERYYAERKAAEQARLMASSAVDGIHPRKRRKHHR
ncbi:MAG: hypothetical protein EB060_11820 [Proteobacteria bacterium]|nr:hypothetical protein [Pseudomonadota bacterium]